MVGGAMHHCAGMIVLEAKIDGSNQYEYQSGELNYPQYPWNRTFLRDETSGMRPIPNSETPH